MTQLVLPNSIDAGTEIVAAEHQQNYEAIRDLINGQLEGGSGSSGNLKANGITARELADNLLLRGMPTQDVQEGVIGAGDLKVTPGAGLVLNFAAGTAWITDDSGVLASGALIPVTVAGGSVTIAANASGNPRIDQIVLTMTDHGVGSVSIAQGTATVGATLDNRAGVAALPSNAIRLADILMPNAFAGPFVQTTHIRDRRPWARGAHWFSESTLGDITGTNTTFTTTDVLFPGGPTRLEVSSGLVVVEGSGVARTSIANVYRLGVGVDGATPTNQVVAQDIAATGNSSWAFHKYMAVAAGSHLFNVHAFNSLAGTWTQFRSATVPLRFRIREVVEQTSGNDGA